MDDTTVEKVDDNTVKVSTPEIVDVSVLKQNLVDAQTQLQNFEDWVPSQRVSLQGLIDAAQAILDKVSAIGIDVNALEAQIPANEITP